MLVSLLTHKLLGGIGEGEVTDLKTAIGNFKITGPIVVLAFSTGALWWMFSKSDAISRITSIPGEKEIVVFTLQKGQSTDVNINNDSNLPMFTIKNSKTSLFDYFVEKCYLDKVEGCKSEITFKINDELARPGKAIVCKGSITGVRILISNKNKKSMGLRNPVPVELSADPDCSYEEKTILISSKDAQKAKINKDGDRGYISPFLGKTIRVN